MKEPDVGAWVKEHGAVICHIMRPAYVGKKVAFDCSTQSMRIYRIGILEQYIPHEGFFRSVIFTGKKQRTLLTHFPGVEIYEPLPWDEYQDRSELFKKIEREQMSLWRGGENK